MTSSDAKTFIGRSEPTFTLAKFKRAFAPTRASPLRWAYLALFYLQPGVDRQAVMHWIASPDRPDAWLGVHARVSLFFVVAFALTTWLAAGFMEFIYKVNWPVFEQYRINPTPWPWHQSTRPEEERSKEYQPYMKLVNATWAKLKNTQVFVSVVLFCALYFYCKEHGTDEAFQRMIDTTPPWTTSFWHCMAGFFLFDTFFFCGHWLLHHSWMYRFHKLHHEYKRPMALTGQHGTFADGLIAMIIPSFVLYHLVDMHIYTGIMFTIASMTQSVDDHCGYALPFTPLCLIPFAGFTAEHDWHHTGNHGNYGLYFTHWDTLFGTDTNYLKQMAAGKQHDRRKLQ